MKLSAPQVSMFNTLLGKTVALILEHDKVNRGWYTIRKIDIGSDVTGEYEYVKVGLCTIIDTKWAGEYHLCEVLTVAQVNILYQNTQIIADTINTIEDIPEYLKEALKQVDKLKNLLDTYPGDYAGVKSV